MIMVHFIIWLIRSIFLRALKPVLSFTASQFSLWGKGQFHNIKNQKEHQNICKPSQHQKSLFSSPLLLQSEHQKWLFSWSLLQQKSDFWCSDFTYGVKKDHNFENQNINYLWHITYGYRGLWGPGGLR